MHYFWWDAPERLSKLRLFIATFFGEYAMLALPAFNGFSKFEAARTPKSFIRDHRLRSGRLNASTRPTDGAGNIPNLA